MSDQTERRNAAAQQQALADMDARLRAQQIRIDGLNATVTMLQRRVDDMEATFNLARVAAVGRGPSVR